MPEKVENFSIIFKEIEKISDKSEIWLNAEEIEEYDEIRTIRQIVLQMQAPLLNYYTST